MKIEGIIYNDHGDKVCDFTSVSKDAWANCRREVLVPKNKIKFTDCSLHEFDVAKIAQIYKTLCEMI